MKTILTLILTTSFAGVASLSATQHNLKAFEDCYTSCNKAFIEDTVKIGEMQSAGVEFTTEMMNEVLQKTLKKIAPICTAEDVQLLKDAMCFFVEKNMCRAGNKLIELPPFTPDAKNVSTDLKERIAGRLLTNRCFTGYPR